MGCVSNRRRTRQGDRFRIDIVVQARVGMQKVSTLPVALWQQAAVSLQGRTVPTVRCHVSHKSLQMAQHPG
jgi:hypothetical protein